MAIMGAVMKIKSARREEIEQKLEKFSGVSLESESPAGELVLLIEAENLGALHKTSQKLEKLDGVLGIYPAYVTTEDEE